VHAPPGRHALTFNLDVARSRSAFERTLDPPESGRRAEQNQRDAMNPPGRLRPRRQAARQSAPR
jgi:hypothetical protein